MKIKTALDLLTISARRSLSRARFACVLVYFRNEKGVQRLELRRSENVCVHHFLQAIQSHQSVCLYGPLYEKPVGCSGTVQRDLCSAIRNPNIVHAPILRIKQSLLALNVVIKTWIVVCVGLILMENPMPTNPPISSSFPKVDFSWR